MKIGKAFRYVKQLADDERCKPVVTRRNSPDQCDPHPDYRLGILLSVPSASTRTQIAKAPA